MRQPESRFAALRASSPDVADLIAALALDLLGGRKLVVPERDVAPTPGSAAAEVEALIDKMRSDIAEALRMLREPRSRGAFAEPYAEDSMRELLTHLLSVLALREKTKWLEEQEDAR